jgi:DNA-binding NarL/FixJ family response regulator
MGSPPPAARGAAPRLLVADDHPVVRRGLESLLTEAFPGSHVGQAATAAEALALLDGGGWSLLVLDLSLPDRTGLDALREVRRRHPEVPVLVVSAAEEAEQAVPCIRLGAAGYLSKRRAADELALAVRRALDGGRYLTPEVAEGLADAVGGAAPRLPHDLLSGRELQVVRLVAAGRTQREIAAELGVSEKTIATYRTRIADKTGLSTIVELTRYAVEHKLVT